MHKFFLIGAVFFLSANVFSRDITYTLLVILPMALMGTAIPTLVVQLMTLAGIVI